VSVFLEECVQHPLVIGSRQSQLPLLSQSELQQTHEKCFNAADGSTQNQFEGTDIAVNVCCQETLQEQDHNEAELQNPSEQC